MFEIAQTSAVETTGGTGAKTQPAWALSQKSLAKVKKHVEDQFFKNNTPQQGRDLILQIIENAPKMAADASSKSMKGMALTQKMGRQFYDRMRGDGCRILMLDRDDEILAFFADPCTIDLSLKDLAGKITGRAKHSARFLVIGKADIWFEDSRTDEALVRAANTGGDRCQFVVVEGNWVHRTAKEHYRSLGFDHRIFVDSQVPGTLIMNARFLDDFLTARPLDRKIFKDIQRYIGSHKAVPYRTMLGLWDANTLFRSLLEGAVYVNLEVEPLYQADDLVIYVDKATADAHRAARQAAMESPLPLLGNTKIAVGSKFTLHAIDYIVEMCHGNQVKVRDPDGHRRSFDIDVLIHLNKTNYLTGVPASALARYEAQLHSHRGIDIERATRRLAQLKAWDLVNSSDRSLREYQEKTKHCKNEYECVIALLDKLCFSGNRQSRLPFRSEELATQTIKDEYNTSTKLTAKAAYNVYQKKCVEESVRPMSYVTFLERVKQREGERHNYQKSPIARSLDQWLPVHGVLPHHCIHFDHTTATVATVDFNGQSLGKPQYSLAVDSNSGRTRALILSYDPECTKLALMLLRDYVRRWGRFPRYLILDNGSPFHSNELEAFCNRFGIDIIWRDANKPRGGSHVERMFGASEEQIIAQCQGNTLSLRDPRMTLKSMDPFKQGVWTLIALWLCIEFYLFEIRPNAIHQEFGVTLVEFERAKMLEHGDRSEFNLQALNEDIMIATAPHTPRPFHKVCQRRGVEVNGRWFWHPAMRTLKKGLRVETKIEMWEASLIYVKIDDRWQGAVSNNLRMYQGRTHRVVQMAERESFRQAGQKALRDRRSIRKGVQLASMISPEHFDPRISAQEKESFYAASHFGLGIALPAEVTAALGRPANLHVDNLQDGPPLPTDSNQEAPGAADSTVQNSDSSPEPPTLDQPFSGLPPPPADLLIAVNDPDKESLDDFLL
jgi:putative transposase